MKRMMKQTAAILMAGLVMISGSSCGKSSSTADETTKGVAQTETTVQKAESTSENSGKQTDSLLPYTYNVPMQKIYVDVPNYQEIEQGHTELFIVHQSRYVAVTAAFNEPAGTAKEAHESAFKDLIIGMQNYEGGIETLTIEHDEETTINGIDVYSFEGTISYGISPEIERYTKGYSFVLDGVPCEIVGSVLDESQDEVLVEEIKNVVSEMIQTLRTEP